MANDCSKLPISLFYKSMIEGMKRGLFANLAFVKTAKFHAKRNKFQFATVAINQSRLTLTLPQGFICTTIYIYVCMHVCVRTNAFLIRPRFLWRFVSLSKCVHFNGKENPSFVLDNFSSIFYQHRKNRELFYYVRFNFYSKKLWMKEKGDIFIYDKSYLIKTKFFFSTRKNYLIIEHDFFIKSYFIFRIVRKTSGKISLNSFILFLRVAENFTRFQTPSTLRFYPIYPINII